MEIFNSALTIGLVSALGAISPGPDFFIVVKNSLCYSRKAGMWTAVGISLALCIHLFYTLAGIDLLTNQSSLLFLSLKYTGAGYLFYIGSKGFANSFKKQSTMTFKESFTQYLASSTAFRQGFFTNLLNPKCALFFVSLFSQFIVAETTLKVKLGYACINWSITLVWFLFLSYLITGKYFTHKFSRFQIWIDRVMGCILMLISLKIIFA